MPEQVSVSPSQSCKVKLGSKSSSLCKMCMYIKLLGIVLTYLNYHKNKWCTKTFPASFFFLSLLKNSYGYYSQRNVLWVGMLRIHDFIAQQRICEFYVWFTKKIRCESGISTGMYSRLLPPRQDLHTDICVVLWNLLIVTIKIICTSISVESNFKYVKGS